jgi:hypothetical protein
MTPVHPRGILTPGPARGSSYDLASHILQSGDVRVSVPASISSGSFDAQKYICYTKKYLLRGGPVDLALQELQVDDIRIAGESTEEDKLLHRAILGLSTVYFGSQHRNSSLMRRGYAIHGLALRQLSSALSDPKCYNRDDVLFSVVTMVLLECFIPTGPKFYLKHMVGLEKLLELRGPPKNCSPMSHQAQEGIRRLSIFASLSMRTPSLFAREEWRSIKSAPNLYERTEDHYLFGILAHYTVLAADHDRMIMDCSQGFNYNQASLLLQRAFDLLGQIHSWKNKWDIEDRNSHLKFSATWTSQTKTHEPRTYPFSTVFTFHNNSAVTTFMLYNTILIYLLRIVISILSICPGDVLHQICTTKDGASKDLGSQCKTNAEYASVQRSAALEICRCIPYFLSEKSRLTADRLTIGHLAFRIAWNTLEGSNSPGRAVGWMAELLNAQGDKVFAKGLWVD